MLVFPNDHRSIVPEGLPSRPSVPQPVSGHVRSGSSMQCLVPQQGRVLTQDSVHEPGRACAASDSI